MPQGPGYGNGTGGAKGMKGTVASAGLATASPSAATEMAAAMDAAPAVATGAFGQQESRTAPEAAAWRSGPPTNAVEITFKPNPVYTEEARA